MKRSHMNWKSWLVIILAVLIAGGLTWWSVVNAKPKPKEEPAKQQKVIKESEPESEPEPELEPESEMPSWHFYNLDLQGDGDETNNLNFGPAVQMDDPELAYEELKFRVSNDPNLGSADMAYFDSILKTRYMGLFYDECNEKWDAAINRAASIWMDNPEGYAATYSAWFAFLDSADKIEIKKGKNLVDQMYQNPRTVSGIPEVIVMETDDHEGTFLVFTFTIKGTTKKEVAYRLECGFQPTNVEKVMNIKPQSSAGGSGGGGKSTISGGGGNKSTISGGGGNPKKKSDPDPKPTPTPEPKYNKDKTKGTMVLPNDDPGPGPNTNNPSDPNTSIKDQPSNSNHMTQDEYNKAIEELKKANEPGGDSQPGGGSNEPTYTPPASSDSGGGSSEPPKQDNNGDSGTGNGGIDKPTDRSDSSVDDETGEAWDGPPD